MAALGKNLEVDFLLRISDDQLFVREVHGCQNYLINYGTVKTFFQSGECNPPEPPQLPAKRITKK